MPYRDPLKKKAYNKKYRQTHALKLSIQQSKWREENKEHVKEWSDAYYASHKQEIVKRNTQYAKEHPSTRKAIDQKRKTPYHKILKDAGRERVCEFCGAIENVHTHHKDLNHNNNKLDNLQWLCGSCHSKLHNELRKEKI